MTVWNVHPHNLLACQPHWRLLVEVQFIHNLSFYTLVFVQETWTHTCVDTDKTSTEEPVFGSLFTFIYWRTSDILLQFVFVSFSWIFFDDPVLLLSGIKSPSSPVVHLLHSLQMLNNTRPHKSWITKAKLMRHVLRMGIHVHFVASAAWCKIGDIMKTLSLNHTTLCFGWGLCWWVKLKRCLKLCFRNYILKPVRMSLWHWVSTENVWKDVFLALQWTFFSIWTQALRSHFVLSWGFCSFI